MCWLVRIVAGALLGVLFSGSNAAADPADAGAASARVLFDDDGLEAWCQRRLLAPFRALASQDEIGAWDEVDPSTLNLDPGFAERADAFWTSAEDNLGTTAVVIALVPDPIDTGYVYQFYEASSAVELGIEQLGYLRDQVWLPWDDSHLQSKSNVPLDEGCRLRVPGALILRDAAGPKEARPGTRPRSVVALLVGETPTEGVHKGTFARAIALARRLESWRVGHLRVVGPTFSGTAESLRAVLDAEEEELDPGSGGSARGASIVSGSATRSAIDSLLTRDGGARSIRFRRTTLDNESTESIFFRWLMGRSIGLGHPERVGLLVEEGTLFGREPVADSARVPADREPGLDRATPSVTLHFRRGIADLQRAHELQDQSARAQATKATPAPLVTPPSSVLDPSFDERTTPRETAPDPSPKRLSALDLELRNLLSEVSREGLTYLAIRATDSGDAVFLAQQVRATAPDVRLIFMTSDVLLLHPALAGDFRGSLIVSPYPFFGTSDLSNGGSSSVHDHFPWESQSSEGIFNAAIALLAADVPYLSSPSGKRDLLSRLAEYAPLSSANGGPEGCAGDEPLLPLWVAVIGNGTVFPVDVIVPEASDRPASSLFDPCEADGTRPPRADPTGPRPSARDGWTLRIDENMSLPNGWTLLLLVFGVGGVAEHLVFRRSLERPAGDHRPSIAGGGAGRPDLMLLYATHLRYAAARSVAIAAVFGYMTTVNFLALRSKPFGSDAAAWRSAVVSGWMVLTCLATALLAASALWRLILSVRVDSKIYVALDELGHWPSVAGPRRVGLRRALVDPAAAVVRILRGDAPTAANARTLHALHASGLYALMTVITGIAAWRTWFDLPTFLAGDLRPTASGVAFVLRSLPLASGVSAAIVVVFLGVALLIWVAGRMQRVELTRGLSLITPDAPRAGDNGAAPALVSSPIGYVTSDAELAALEAHVQNVLQRPAAFRCSLLRSGVIVVLPLAAFFLKPPTSLETGGDTLALVILLSVITLIVGLTAQHLVEFWLALRALLDALRRWGGSSIFPLAAGYVGAPVSRLVTGRHKHVELDELLICAEVARKVPDSEVVRQARTRLASATDDQVASGRDLGRALLELGRYLCAAGAGVAAATMMGAPATEGGGQPGQERSNEPSAPDAELVACVLGLVLNRYVRHARDFMTATSTPAVFIVLVFALYPFEPHRLMMMYAWVLTLSVVGAGVVVLLGMQRNLVLASFAGSPSGRMKLSRDSVVHFLAWVVIPLVSVFAAQFPEFGHLIGAVLDPISSAFR